MGVTGTSGPNRVVVVRPRTDDLLRDARLRLLSSDLDYLFLELCCSEDSTRSRLVPHGCLAVRVTLGTDLTLPTTKKALHSMTRHAIANDIEIHAWVSIACTAGCRLRYLNDKLGITTGDPDFTERLIVAACTICGHISRVGQSFSWEWPETNLLWGDSRVQILAEKNRAVTCLVSTAAVGMSFKHPQTGEEDAAYL